MKLMFGKEEEEGDGKDEEEWREIMKQTVFSELKDIDFGEPFKKSFAFPFNS